MSPNLFRTDASSDADSDASRPGPSPTAEKARGRGRQEPASISVLGAGITVEGEIRSRGDVQIEGTVKGNVSSEGQVSVQGPGTVQGEVRAARVIVAGAVDGRIEARESARLVEGARVDADVSTPRLELEAGAKLNGRVDMSGAAKKPETAPRAVEKSAGPKSTEEPKPTEEPEDRKRGVA